MAGWLFAKSSQFVAAQQRCCSGLIGLVGIVLQLPAAAAITVSLLMCRWNTAEK
jgi:hypothetical protein